MPTASMPAPVILLGRWQEFQVLVLEQKWKNTDVLFMVGQV